MEHEVAQAGDRLKQVIGEAVAALMAGDQKALRKVLDQDAATALHGWAKPEQERARDNDLAQAGDRLKGIIDHAIAALNAGDMDTVWTVLDQDSYLVVRAWDKLRGREVPSLSSLMDWREQIAAGLRKSLQEYHED
jgi:flagellar biosynthesis regulator FlaF